MALFMTADMATYMLHMFYSYIPVVPAGVVHHRPQASHEEEELGIPRVLRPFLLRLALERI